MAYYEGDTDGGASGGESMESSGGEASYADISDNANENNFASSDAELEISDGSGDEINSENDVFSSTDSQLEGMGENNMAENTPAFASSDKELNAAFEDNSELGGSTDKVSEEPAEQIPEETVEKLPEETVEQLPEETEEKLPEETAEKLPEETAEKLPEETSDERPWQENIRPFYNTEDNNTYLRPYNEQLYINDRLSELRVAPNEVLAAVDRDSLRERIERDVYISPDESGRSKYLDITRAKGFVQEEMIKSTLDGDFEVTDHTVKSVHEDGSVTYTDIEASARHDVEISGGTVIHAGEKIAIESKSGDERYLSSQIQHIDKQLEGMPEDAHRMLFVTADVNHLSAADKEKLGETLAKNNATLNVLPYYSQDLTDAVLHMDPRIVSASSEIGAQIEGDIPDPATRTESRFSLSDIFGRRKDTAESVDNAAEDRALSPSEIAETRGADLTEERAAVIARERERLEADTETVKELLEEDRSLNELSESERAAVVNVAVARAMEQDPLMTADKAENFRSRIRFVDLAETANDNMVDERYARRIQGYYSPNTGMKINVDAYGTETSETLVTITHETIHMMAQRYDENNEAIPGMTGLKRGDLPQSSRNVGMNEGVTELYAARNTAELVPDREESSYVREVAVMESYESIVGTDMLNDAYMYNGAQPLKQDFDRYMGSGRFDDLCRMMDKMHDAENDHDLAAADSMRSELERILGEYSRNRKGGGV